ncbi:glycosyltransferase family 39 protein, partial [Cryobacterium sp. 5B3]|uniref:glycosyltransferase family 39 protein n=1 Tax=Cryobacterium sp. 5B3 TaxID=3048586 RepID=UPI002B23DF62
PPGGPAPPPPAGGPAPPPRPPPGGPAWVGSARWERPALLGLLLATAVLYVWDLGASGWANSFYSAAVQAGSVDWTAFFYGSSDAANAITVDKPPASLWLMALSVRLFGLSSWSILVPEALMGVASVGVLFATVRRRFSAGTALLAGAVLAVTPVAALMFRFNNPDALLVLLLSLATYFTLRGVETGKLKWVLWAGAMVGFGFLTKQLQAFLILPPLAGVYLYAAPHRFLTRFWHSFAALGAVIVSAGWWVAVVELVPTSWRPHIGGSQTNSFLELTFGYNGFGRLTGSETGSVTGGAGGVGGAGAAATGGMWGETGVFRLFLGEFGGQITWLLPAALLLLVAALVVLRRAPRISLRRATLLLFAGYLILTALAFSFMAGIFHAYYTVALAPALAGTFAIGASLVWMKRTALWARITAAVAMLATSAWAWVLLDRAVDWLPWLKFVVAALGLIAAALLMVSPRAAWLRRLPGQWWRRATVAIALTVALLAPVAYTLDTVSTAHTGSIVAAGPAVSGGMGGMGGGGMPGGRAGFAGGGTPPAGRTGGNGTLPNGTLPNGTVPNGTVPNGTTGTLPTGGRPGGAGGFMGSASVSASLAALLSVDSGSYTWIAAAVGSDTAAGYQLATQLPVMAIGGFNGSDPAPTLAEFQADVAAGKIHYFIGGRTGQANGGSSASSEIAAWVAESFTAQTVDSVTLYDLSAGATASATS